MNNRLLISATVVIVIAVGFIALASFLAGTSEPTTETTTPSPEPVPTVITEPFTLNTDTPANPTIPTSPTATPNPNDPFAEQQVFNVGSQLPEGANLEGSSFFRTGPVATPLPPP